jgi:hypothetical protein
VHPSLNATLRHAYSIERTPSGCGHDAVGHARTYVDCVHEALTLFPDSPYSDTIRAEKMNGRRLRMHSGGVGRSIDKTHRPGAHTSARRKGRRVGEGIRGTRREGDLDRPPSPYNRTIRLYFSMIIFRDSMKPGAAMR